MNQKHFVRISIPCQSAEELQKAKEAVLFHLETLNPEFSAEGTPSQSRSFLLTLNSSFPTRHATSSAKPSPSPSPSTTAGPALSKQSINPYLLTLKSQTHV